MLGLYVKAIREVRLQLLLLSAALFGIMTALTHVVPQVQEELISQVWEQLPFVKTMISTLLGIDIEDHLNAQMLQSFVWVHPVVLTLIWAHEIIFCTRTPAGEIDRGTIDILLGLPVSRKMLFLCESSVWLITGIIIIASGALGFFLASRSMPADQRPAPAIVLMILTNLLCLYIAVGGISYLVSSLSSRRGRAISVIFGIVLGSFFLNFLAQFWTPAQSVSFLGVLEYYRPAMIMLDGKFPTADIATLLAVGLSTWLAALFITTRRNICTT